MKRGHRAHGTGVSLFPFLDVLVCTMGSLILLLLVATNRIRSAAVERAKQTAIAERTKVEEEAAATPEKDEFVTAPLAEEDPTAEWKTRIEQMIDERDALQEQLSQLRSRLSAAQSAVAKSKNRAVSTADQLQHIRTQQESAESQRQRLAAEIESLQSDLTEAEERLAKAAARKQTANSKFAFIPFDGRTGTTKRPILIECAQNAIRFLPEGIQLTLTDLDGFPTGFNPLLNGVREMVRFWKTYDEIHETGGTAAEPYVLLLVRPDGIREFGLAKQLLTELKIPHGYELLDSSMELDLPEPNPKAKMACADVIAQTLAKRHEAVGALRRDGLLRDESQLIRSAGGLRGGPGGEARDLDENLTNRRPGTGSGEGTAKGTGTSRGDARMALAEARQHAFESGRGRRPLGVDADSQPLGGDAGGRGGSPANSGRGGSTSGSGDSTEGTPAAMNRRSGNGSSSFGQIPPGDFPVDEPLPGGGAARDAADDTRPFPLTNRRLAAGGPTGSSSGVAPGGQTEPTIPRSRQARSLDYADPYADANSSRGARGSGERRSNPVKISGDDDQVGGSVSTTVTGKKKSATSDIEMRKKMRKFAMLKPGIGLEKAIPIRVWPDHILVGDNLEIRVDSQTKTDTLAERVLMATDQVQARWPDTGKGYHWVPTLRYEVVPGGEQLHQRLNTALFDLGMTSKVEYLPNDPDAGPPRETSRSRAGDPAGQTAERSRSGGGVR